MISFNNVSFSYGDTPFINDLNLTISDNSKGNIIGIIGPNGSGKSTFIHLLLGYLTPKEGVVKIENELFTTYTQRELAKRIGHLSQNYQRPFGYRVDDYVAMGQALHDSSFQYHSKHAKDKANEYMKLTDTFDFAHKSIKSLSGGEFQRVRLARVLAQETPIIVLDEALSAMDVAFKSDMMKVIKEEAETKGKIVIMVMHDLQLAYQCTDEIIVFHQGKLKAQGSTKEVMTSSLIEDTYNVATTFHDASGFIIKF